MQCCLTFLVFAHKMRGKYHGKAKIISPPEARELDPQQGDACDCAAPGAAGQEVPFGARL
jgi:hypothetical protein